MLSKIMDTAKLIEGGMQALPPYVDDQGPDAWAESFALRRQASRQLLGEAIVRSGDGVYIGDIGEHTLEIHGTIIDGDASYEQLMSGWLDAANAAGGAA